MCPLKREQATQVSLQHVNSL